MAELTYRRATEKDDLGLLREFVLSNFKRKTEDSIGCLEGQALEWVARMMEQHEDLVYVVAEAGGEKDPTLVGVYVVDIHPPSQKGVHLRVIALALSPDYDQNSLYYNMNIALTEFVKWPGCCGNSWTALMPAGKALDFIAATEFGLNMEQTPYKEVFMAVRAEAPVKEKLVHTDVPLAKDGGKPMTAEEVKAAQEAALAEAVKR